MAVNPVFGRKHSAQGFAMFQEKGIVAHAQAQQDIEIGVLAVEDLSLRYRMAHGLKSPGLHLLPVLHPQPLFSH